MTPPCTPLPFLLVFVDRITHLEVQLCLSIFYKAQCATNELQQKKGYGRPLNSSIIKKGFISRWGVREAVWYLNVMSSLITLSKQNVLDNILSWCDS